MAETRDTYAYFFVRDFDCDVSEITQLLGFAPTEAHNRTAPLPSGRRRKSSSWRRVSDLPRDTVFSEHLEALLPILESHSTEIESVSTKFHLGLQCVGYFTGAHPGFHMTTGLIARVAALKLSIDFDLYCYCDGECDQPADDPSASVT